MDYPKMRANTTLQFLKRIVDVSDMCMGDCLTRQQIDALDTIMSGITSIIEIDPDNSDAWNAIAGSALIIVRELNANKDNTPD